MKNFILKKILLQKRLSIISEKKDFYSKKRTDKEIYEYQLQRFNEVWENATINIPFYKMWKEKHNLPSNIENIEDIKKFPVLTKKDIQEYSNLIFNDLSEHSSISTGGSSGKPVKFPLSKNDLDIIYSNCYALRDRLNIKPLDKILLFWGHSHLFGTGVMGIINKFKRYIYDGIVNTVRLNAYDMSVESIHRHCVYIKKNKFDMILGYTSVLLKIAKYINENNFHLNIDNKLKCIVLTSEHALSNDIDYIESVFKVPCIIEYGMAETGVIAYSSLNSKNLDVLWDSFLLTKGENDSLIISTLTDKLFPLINYNTEDKVEVEEAVSIIKINKIFGRSNDTLMVYNNQQLIEVHSEIFTHVLKSINHILSFQIIQKKDFSIEIKYVSVSDESIKNIFFKELRKEFRYLNNKQFLFTQVNDIQKTLAGKEKWIIKEN